MSEDSEAEQLKEAQQEREEAEAEQAASAVTDDEAAQHRRRAEKAAYLREKLEQRAETEREGQD